MDFDILKKGLEITMDNKLIVSLSPHIHTKESISDIMLDVIIALIPASCMGVYCYGMRAAVVILTAIAASILSEYAYEKLMKKPITTGDLSAMVTGLLMGLNLPVSIPLWMVVIGSAFAIIIVKQLYGGLGKNYLNPALAARCFMLAAWAGAMTVFSEPLMSTQAADAVSAATPLAVMKGTSAGTLPSYFKAFIGFIPGSIGETSAAMLLIGGAYLLIKRVINWKIPVTYIAVFAVLTFLFGKNTTELTQGGYTLMQLLCGGLMLGAFFMATDYTTTPITPRGQLIFGIGCGVLTFVIRQFGGYPEGVSFSILLMNISTPLIDKYTAPKKFGARKA